MHDPVHNPSHYTKDRTMETIQVIEDWGLDHHLACCLKYVSRAGRKNGSSVVEDLEKAIWYLRRRITLELNETSL